MVESERCGDVWQSGNDVWLCLVCVGGGGVCRLGHERKKSTNSMMGAWGAKSDCSPPCVCQVDQVVAVAHNVVEQHRVDNTMYVSEWSRS
eukprot:6455247-Amphidinium_carterae.1